MAGTTPRLALPYPTSSDTVDVPRDVQALADKLDTVKSIGVPLVSSLPVSPADGDEVYLLVDATNGIIWHFRYRAASATEKWEFIGGPALEAESDGTVTTSGTHTAWQTTGGPTLTLPGLGTYDIEIDGWMGTAAVAGNASLLSFALGGVAPGADNFAVIASTSAAVSISGSARRSSRLSIGTPANLALSCMQRSNTANAVTCRFRRLLARPVRLA